ncbi:hypothetical protein [Halorientalis sp.]|jgi:hypothetical protein|nr:hypothetical protein [Halorientalis sp.]
MEYVQSSSGKWHRADCQYSPDGGDGENECEQLPIDADRCQHCIDSFEFS